MLSSYPQIEISLQKDVPLYPDYRNWAVEWEAGRELTFPSPHRSGCACTTHVAFSPLDWCKWQIP